MDTRLRRQVLTVFTLFFAATLAVSPRASAQGAMVTGQVVDETGGVLPGASGVSARFGR